MGPAELAALVAREADAGVAGALRAMDAAGVLTVERVVGRIGSRPATDTTPWEDIVWQAEVVMRPSGLVREQSTAPGEGPAPDPGGVAGLVGSLSVRALRGVGARWTAQLSRRGVESVADLASTTPAEVARWSQEKDGGYAVQLVARARTCVGPWPPVDPHDTRSVLEVSESDPGDVSGWPPGSRPEAYLLWGSCLRLRAALDDAVLALLRVNGS
ncbi:hypothetical protein GCM10022415_29920 [Knoellia locipacati]|uniref:Uncharacterized protein n=1 Tax=Knoellia locipacati TaxID=882824 RepID=A0A512T469_9MICO|nr:hypothetical protein [Knoellia locipacati]GEQ15004.1 hypothetical protein KLO01_30510 [Knoellia locipacati]